MKQEGAFSCGGYVRRKGLTTHEQGTGQPQKTQFDLSVLFTSVSMWNQGLQLKSKHNKEIQT